MAEEIEIQSQQQSLKQMQSGLQGIRPEDYANMGHALGGQLVRGPDPMDDLHAALRFLKWCQLNTKSTKLAEEWLIAEAKKLAT